jgi:hypothetical protein
MKNKHRGSSFDDFLKEEGLFEGCHDEAVRRVIAFQLASRKKKSNDNLLMELLASEEACYEPCLAMSSTE